MKTVRDAFSAIYDCPVPVIAAVHGHALGTGVALVGSCDLVVCGDSACFGVPEVSVGVMGGAKASFAARARGRFAPHVFDCRPHSGCPTSCDTAASSRSCQTTSCWRQRLALAAAHCPNSRAAIRMAKVSLNVIEYMDLKAGYEAEQALTGRLVGTADSVEARQAIVKRREPRFKSKVF